MAKCMQCGGATKMKKMKMGGAMGIVGMPKYSNDPKTDAGRTLKKGGVVKKYQDGGDTSIAMQKISSKDPYEIAKKVNATKMLQSKKEALLKLAASKNKLQKDTAKKYAKGGSSFGMLSVKAGVDKNPNPTAADRIAGAKMKKAKFGTSVKVQHSPAPGRVRSSSGTGTVPVGMRKKKGGSVKK